MEIVGSAGTRQEAFEMWEKTRPDITLMDLSLEGGAGGVEAIRQIRQNSASAKIIVFSALTADEDVYQALQSGAKSRFQRNRNRYVQLGVQLGGCGLARPAK